jgi:hypothetical protein
MLTAPRGIWTNLPTSCSRKVRRGLVICDDCEALTRGISLAFDLRLRLDASWSRDQQKCEFWDRGARHRWAAVRLVGRHER